MKNIIIKKMSEIVEKKLTHYKSDFYNYDIKLIKENETNCYIWIIRSTGTWLLKTDNLKDCESTKTIYNYCMDENESEKRCGYPKKHTFYYIDIQAGIIRQLKKDYTIKDILDYHEKQKRKKKVA